MKKQIFRIEILHVCNILWDVLEFGNPTAWHSIRLHTCARSLHSNILVYTGFSTCSPPESIIV